MATIAETNFKQITLKSCHPENASYVLEFHQKLANETTFLNRFPGQAAMSEETIREKWSQIRDSQYDLCIHAMKTNKLVGEINFTVPYFAHPWKKHVGRFWIALLEETWGMGLGKKLLSMVEDHAKLVQISRLEAEVRSHNHRGIQFYLANGFQIEGVRRKAALINNEYIDEYYIGKILN